MSRRKDRERFLAQRHLNPEYQGFRGLEAQPDRAGNTPLGTVICSVCGKRRNVPVGIAMEQEENYVCLSCREEAGEEVEAEEAAG